MGQTYTFRDCERPLPEIVSEIKKDSRAPAIAIKEQKSPSISSSDHSEAYDTLRGLAVPHSLFCDITKANLLRAPSSVFSPISMSSPASESDFDWSASRNDLFNNKGKTREEIGMSKLKAMQACGVNVKRFTTHGDRSALMFAVLSQELDFVKGLVADGADVMAKNEHGETALDLAKSLPSQEIYNFLQQYIAKAVHREV